jgi:succinate dehydrogenase/fumarate reductase flavoprotein subunit
MASDFVLDGPYIVTGVFHMPLGYYLYSTGRETDDMEFVAVHFRHVVEQHPDVADVVLDVGCYALRGDRILLGPTKWVLYGPVEPEELDRRMESGEIAEILERMSEG